MKDIKCPECGTTFQVDDSAYAAILEQVRTNEFSKELAHRLDEIKEQFKLKEDAIKARAEKEFERSISDKEREVNTLNSEIMRLKGIISGYDATKQSEITKLEADKARELFEAINEKDRRIAELMSQISSDTQAHKVAILEERNAAASELQAKEKSIIELQSRLEAKALESQNRENQLREQHQLQIQDKQAEIDRLKDFKLRLSTKMVGETLEQHCAILFEHARSMGQYPEATFEKDNLAVEHSKGDFIFRDFYDGNEYVSIMFEMKNEMDATATKHRNDDFLDKLDKDRTRKGCEYAILVSMLELDNPLYDDGIVDKSHRYPKMLVIRPQFFLQVLRLITECAKKGYAERYTLISELETARSQRADFAKFEEKINNFRTKFNNNVSAAHKKFVAATEGIDKTIEALEKQITALRQIKANFEASEQRLLKANELADEDLTVKKLTYGNPAVRKMIQDAKDQPDTQG